MFIYFSSAGSQPVHLHFADWLDGIHKTVLGSIKEAEDVDQDAAGKEQKLSVITCILTIFTQSTGCLIYLLYFSLNFKVHSTTC